MKLFSSLFKHQRKTADPFLLKRFVDAEQLHLRLRLRFRGRLICRSNRVGDMVIILGTDVVLCADVYLLVFRFHSGDCVFELNVFGCETAYFILLALYLHVGVHQEILFCKSLLRATQKPVVERYSFLEIGRTVLEYQIATMISPEALGAPEHGGEYDHGDDGQLLVATQTVISQHFVFQRIARTGGGEHVCRDVMGGVHHPHNGYLEGYVVMP